MKSFKEYVTMNETIVYEIVDYNTMKLPRLRKLLVDLQMKKTSARTQNKKLQFQNQIGIIKSVIADKVKQEMNEKDIEDEVDRDLMKTFKEYVNEAKEQQIKQAAKEVHDLLFNGGKAIDMKNFIDSVLKDNNLSRSDCKMVIARVKGAHGYTGKLLDNL